MEANGKAESESLVTRTEGELSLSPAEAIVFAVKMHRRGQIKAAEPVYRALLTVDPDHAEATQFLGVLMHQKGEHEAALELLERATILAPDDAGLWTNFGNVLVEMGKLDRAIEAYDKALVLKPDFALPCNNLGIVLRAMGEPVRAEALYRRALEIAPDHAESHHNLGGLLIATGRHEEALQHGMRAVTLLDIGQVGREIMASAYVHLGEIDKAREVYREWARIEPDNPVPVHLLGACNGELPERASDSYVERTFDDFASTFDSKLAHLGYLAPAHVAEALGAALPEGTHGLAVLDAGCGTGLCGQYLRPYADRLVGVDLSGRMLRKAHEGSLYDDLFKGEIVAFLESQDEAFDVVVTCDTLCYFGRVDAFLAAARGALRRDGVLVATFEALPEDSEDDFRLAPNGRYAHGAGYLDRAVEQAGLSLSARRGAVLRQESGRPVQGWIVTATRP